MDIVRNRAGFVGIVAILAASVATALGLHSCGQRVTYDGLYVTVSAEAGVKPAYVAFRFLVGKGADRKVMPRDPEDFPRYQSAVGDRDLSKDPKTIKVKPPNEAFAGLCTLVVLGTDGKGKVLGRAVLQVDLTAATGVEAILRALPEGCDKDGDGFPAKDCCQGESELCDCDDQDPQANPAGFEDQCTYCDDNVDQDCDGKPARCLDADGDHGKECLPSWCEEESKGSESCKAASSTIDCNPKDPQIFPKAKERCDQKDNDCNGQTDEGVDSIEDFDGSTRKLGEGCGTGACAWGKVVCDPETGLPVCSSWQRKADVEKCGNQVDDDCDGETDEGCVSEDADGDGVEDSIEDDKCGPVAKFHAEIFPELENGSKHEGPIPCCPPGRPEELCDWKCDGSFVKCSEQDEDGDGHVAGAETDCDDSDPTVYAGAPEKCGDSMDQDCKLGDLPCSQVVDADGDGYPAQVDCNDQDPNVHPFAQERCNGIDDDCNGYVDDGNPEAEDAECGSDVGECHKGTLVCYHDPNTGEPNPGYCYGEQAPVPEVCDGKDNDCDGETDEDFFYVEGSGETCMGKRSDCEGAPGVGEHCDGVGECGVGAVECAGDQSVRCSTDVGGSAYVEVAETCNNRDDDCDGLTDEDLTDVQMSTCLKVGVCGTHVDQIKAKCKAGEWMCDYSNLEGYEAGQEKSCDGLDNDCDGETDEDFTYLDPITGLELKVGEGCGTGACANGTVVCKNDQSGLWCNTSQLQSGEVCDQQDNDCDGLVDEDFEYDGQSIYIDPGSPDKGPNSCLGIGECGKYPGVVECSGQAKATCSTNPDGSDHKDAPEACDNKDNDCDGLTDEDLTDVQMSDCLKQGVCGSALGKISAVCVAGVWNCDYDAVPFYEPSKEHSCDGLDNDCDGQTDEDFEYTDWDGTKKEIGDACGTGICAGGTVVCNADGSGLTCSTLKSAKSENCNGLDDDCDGLYDEDFDYEGTTVYKDPGNPAAGKNSCDGIGACGYGVVECASLIKATCSTNPDGSNPQSGDETCNGLDDDCDGQTDEGLGLSDSPCSTTGVCTPDNVSAYCVNGKWVCDYSQVAGYEAGKEVSCDNKDNDCDGGTDEDTDSQCDDGIACTDDFCQGGQCKHTVVDGFCLIGENCYSDESTNPQNQCQYCDATANDKGWTNRPNGSACDDGNECKDPDTCQGGACKSGPDVDCEDHNPCTTDTCDPASGCEHTDRDGQSCDDGNACTYGDTCDKFTCKGTAYQCDDNLDCTFDQCDGKGGCTYPIKQGYCLIFNVCYQDGAKNPDNECEACEASKDQTSWTQLTGTPCDDGDKCTLNDTCNAGNCIPGDPKDCNDTNPCTDDNCNKDTGECYYTNNTASCDDGDPCTENDQCSGGNCTGTPKVCPAKNPTCDSSDGVCKCGTEVCGSNADTCSNGTCKCGNSLACDTNGINPDCVNGTCNCGSVLCSSQTADTCSNGTCKCGTGDACPTGQVCCGTGTSAYCAVSCT